jgi:hypothetical protein
MITFSQTRYLVIFFLLFSLNIAMGQRPHISKLKITEVKVCDPFPNGGLIKNMKVQDDTLFLRMGIILNWAFSDTAYLIRSIDTLEINFSQGYVIKKIVGSDTTWRLNDALSCQCYFDVELEIAGIKVKPVGMRFNGQLWTPRRRVIRRR